MITPHDIAKMLDHSLLKPEMDEATIRRGLEVAKKYDVASICVRPCDVKLAREMLEGTQVHVSTVVGFPHGSNRTEVKVLEAQLAMDDGATELDMVLNIGKLLSGADDAVRADIKAVVDASHARGAIVKVILENAYLTDAQKVRACLLATEAGADFVKTSTGFAPSGAKLDDLKLMRKCVPDTVKVKAAGGVRTLDAVLECREAGCTRCGATATEVIMQEAERRFAEQGTL